ncbi:hypothetical protein [Piscinibacterium candidicorallinum]|uniref:TonB C-terminal domain-containing protein n=1 Tax=Piscinibacterium candidicorallinum TaxID=1793872 RepID=A0ABV7HCY9_9BURK
MSAPVSRRLAMAAALCVWIAAPAVQAQLPELSHSFVRPVTFVPPELPADFGKQMAGTVFTLSLVVDPFGRVERIEALEPANPLLRKAIDEVARYWMFHPQVDRARCETEPGAGVIQLEFAAGESRPRMWMSVRADRPAAGEAMKLVGRPPVPEYPRSALQGGVAAQAYATAFKQADGSVADIKVRALVSRNAPPGRDWGFERSVRTAMAHYRFEPDPGAQPICFIVPFAFRIDR